MILKFEKPLVKYSTNNFADRYYQLFLLAIVKFKSMKFQKSILILIILFFVVNSYAQQYFIRYNDGKHDWGYIDLQGNVVIPAQKKKGSTYMWHEMSSDGIIIKELLKSNASEIYDQSMNQIIPSGHGDIFVPVIGVAYAKDAQSRNGVIVYRDNKEKKLGVFTIIGEEVFPPEFDDITPFDEGFAIGKIKKEYFILRKDGSKKLINIDGVVRINEFHQKRAQIQIKKDKEKYWGIIDTDGNLIVEPVYKYIKPFYGNRSLVRNMNDKFGYINLSGDLVIDTIYQKGQDFDPVSGLTFVYTFNEGEWFYLDTNGTQITLALLDKPKKFEGGYARLRIEDKIGFVNSKGEWAIEPQYKGARFFVNGYCAVRSFENDLWGLIDQQGNWVIEPKYIKIKDVIIVQQ